MAGGLCLLCDKLTNVAKRDNVIYRGMQQILAIPVSQYSPYSGTASIGEHQIVAKKMERGTLSDKQEFNFGFPQSSDLGPLL